MFPDEISAVSVASFDRYMASKWQNVNKLGLCGNFRDFKVTLILKLQTSNFSQTNITCRSDTHYSYRLDRLTIVSYRGKYGKKCRKISKYGLYG